MGEGGHVDEKEGGDEDVMNVVMEVFAVASGCSHS